MRFASGYVLMIFIEVNSANAKTVIFKFTVLETEKAREASIVVPFPHRGLIIIPCTYE